MLKKRTLVVCIVASLVLFLQACDSKRERTEATRLDAIADAHDEIRGALEVLKLVDDTDRRFDAVMDIRHGFNRLRQFNDLASGAAYVEPLSTLLGDKDPIVRLLVCDMIGRVGIRNPEAERRLSERLSDADERVRFQAALALVRIGVPKPQCEGILREGLRDDLEPVREEASWALEEMKRIESR
jgi:HEAT repeat protein